MNKNFKLEVFCCLLLTLIPVSIYARIGESQFMAEKRYGKPDKNSTNDKVFPVIPELAEDIISRTYNYNGWKIRCAFYKERTIRIMYLKANQKGVSPYIQNDEIQAILDGERGKGSWQEYKKSLNPLTRITESIKYKNSWQNTNGNIAYLHGGNLVLTIDSPEVDVLIKNKKEKAENDRKSNIPKF